MAEAGSSIYVCRRPIPSPLNQADGGRRDRGRTRLSFSLWIIAIRVSGTSRHFAAQQSSQQTCSAALGLRPSDQVRRIV